jgi:hypothetical protein
MRCLLSILSLFMPRLVMVIIWLFTSWFSVAFQTILWPILGFIFMPYTTLAYMATMINNNHTVSGGWLVLIVFAVLVDLAHHGMFSRRRAWRRQGM